MAQMTGSPVTSTRIGRARSNRSIDTDTQRHCAASRAREHTSRGAMPPRAGQLRRQATPVALRDFQASKTRNLMRSLSPNAQLISQIFDEIAKGNGTPFWNACHDDVVWRTIGGG